jgi:hypothetical protein
MRGKRGQRRTIAAVLAESLAGRSGATRVAAAAAFAEACGWPLAREAAVRGLGPDGRLWVLASSAEWGQEIERLSPQLRDRVNARLGRQVVTGIDVRVRRARA